MCVTQTEQITVDFFIIFKSAIRPTTVIYLCEKFLFKLFFCLPVTLSEKTLAKRNSS